MSLSNTEKAVKDIRYKSQPEHRFKEHEFRFAHLTFLTSARYDACQLSPSPATATFSTFKTYWGSRCMSFSGQILAVPDHLNPGC